MRTVIVAAVILLGLVGVVLGWQLRAKEASFAFATGVGGTLLICTGMYILISTPTQLQAYTYPMLIVTSIAGIVAMGWALRLWRQHNHAATASSTNRTNLSIALGGGAAVALLTAWLQLFVAFVAEGQQNRDKVTSEQQRERTLREDFRFRIAITEDLTGFSPPKDPGSDTEILDLSELGLRGKELPGSNLENVHLHGSDLVEANLFGSRMRGARLDMRTGAPRTDLRAATLRGADLRNARLEGANLTEADLRGAFVHGAKFSGARLEWADLRQLFCGQDTNEPKVCTEAELVGLGLPAVAERPRSACWPPMDPADEERQCGKQARNIYYREHPRR